MDKSSLRQSMMVILLVVDSKNNTYSERSVKFRGNHSSAGFLIYHFFIVSTIIDKSWARSIEVANLCSDLSTWWLNIFEIILDKAKAYNLCLKTSKFISVSFFILIE